MEGKRDSSDLEAFLEQEVVKVQVVVGGSSYGVVLLHLRLVL